MRALHVVHPNTVTCHELDDPSLLVHFFLVIFDFFFAFSCFQFFFKSMFFLGFLFLFWEHMYASSHETLHPAGA